ncbi:geminin-like [Rhopilema esculentum]|uniref:geminin-like n=1 Tax=Rhopilema esculentum TaxID=499914 RepID=UPI0031D6EF0B|eukprot:gene11641-21884_t
MAMNDHPLLSETSIGNKENVEVINKKSEMKTIPQNINKVCASFGSNQTKPTVSLEASKITTARPLSTKSPISGRTLKPAKRRGLAILQPTASNKNVTVTGLWKASSSCGDQKQKKFEIFTEKDKSEHGTRPKSCRGEENRQVVTSIAATQTDFEEWLSLEEMKSKDSLAEEALALMRSEPSQEQYFKTIAEERRLALEETLKENEELYDELDSLKERYAYLEKALNEAENYKILYLAMLEKQTGNDSDEK